MKCADTLRNIDKKKRDLFRPNFRTQTAFVWARKFCLILFLFVLAIWISGCFPNVPRKERVTILIPQTSFAFPSYASNICLRTEFSDLSQDTALKDPFLSRIQEEIIDSMKNVIQEASLDCISPSSHADLEMVCRISFSLPRKGSRNIDKIEFSNNLAYLPQTRQILQTGINQAVSVQIVVRDSSINHTFGDKTFSYSLFLPDKEAGDVSVLLSSWKDWVHKLFYPKNVEHTAEFFSDELRRWKVWSFIESGKIDMAISKLTNIINDLRALSRKRALTDIEHNRLFIALDSRGTLHNLLGRTVQAQQDWKYTRK